AGGKRVSCPSCKKPFMIPALGNAPPAAPPLAAAVSPAAPAAPVAPAKPPSGSVPRPQLPSGAFSVSSPGLSSAGNGARSGAASAVQPASTPSVCPACGSKLLEGAIACMDCGFLIQADGAPTEPEGPPNLCANPSCGVANPPRERNCQRCGTPLAA